MCTLLWKLSLIAADEVTERVDSGGDLEEGESSSVGSLLFEDSEEDESGSVEDTEEDESASAGYSEEDEPDDPRVQEEVCSRNDGTSNSTEICA